MLSLGIVCDFTEKVTVHNTEANIVELTEQFLEIYRLINVFRTNHSLQAYQDMFQSYLCLANLLGYTNVEIEQAYLQKNEVNYERQQQGY